MTLHVGRYIKNFRMDNRHIKAIGRIIVYILFVMFANILNKIRNNSRQCSLCDKKITSYEEWKKHIVTEEHKENRKVEELTWKQIYEDILFIA